MCLKKCQFFVTKSGEKNYFQFFDKIAFRKEHDTKNKKAVANFNNKKEVKKLNKLFKEILNKSILISV